MTISSQTRKAGPFLGNDSTVTFPFTFKVFAADEVYVVRADSAGAETVLTLNSDYTVSLNANQNSNPGGSITLSAALATGYTLVLTSEIEYLQPTDLTNQGGFYPKVINDALDRLTILSQQLKEEVDRSAKLPITSAADADALVADIVRIADSADEIDTVAGSIANVNAVGTDIADVSTVAGSIANVNATGGSIASVNTVATNIAAVNDVSANMTAVTNAVASATAAATSASQAATSATNAANSASSASTSATNAASSASSASTSATNAGNSATAAASSATSASGSATTATTKASEASTSATNAATSASAAATSASQAATSATNAGNSATAAASSASSASTSATNAGNSATAAASSASAASTSATNAAASETAAQNWAIKTDAPVSGGEYSAKWWAQEAASIVTEGVIDDGVTSTAKTWSSSKINTELGTKLPLAGGTMTGNITFAGTQTYGGVRITQGAGSNSTNIGIGTDALRDPGLTGWPNVVMGANAAYALTTGGSNTVVGHDALRLGTGASSNTVVGSNALYTNNSFNNTAIGKGALYYATGYGNTAIGESAGNAITTGNYNVIVGSNDGSGISGTNRNVLLSDGLGNVKVQFDQGGAMGLAGANYGTAGQVPVSQGAGLPPVWGAVSSPEIKTPTNVSPTSGATNIGATPALTGSTYYSLYGIAMAAGQWQVATDSGFTSLVVNTGDVAGTAVTYNVGSGVLSVSTTYYWRVRYKDANGTYSEWSTATTFTTAASFGPTTIGEAYGGGYYAGKIVQGGSTYYLIVAPKASGESSSKQWKTSNDAGPAATITLNNGPAASVAMNSATYPAAQFCEGLSIGGYTDWYLPSRDELELCYRNLKPTTTANNTSARSKSSYTYPEGNDVSGDTMGINRNSDPTGAAYTSGTPAQTSVTLFQTGNSEAFAAVNYWSSSEYSSADAWRQHFSTGSQTSVNKDNSFYARAVRRLPV
jgi:hypothetical protein